MSLEEALLEHTAALKENTAVLQRVVAGQQAAIEKIEGAKPATTRTRAPKKDDTPAPAPTEEQVAGDTPQSFLPGIKVGDDEGLKAHVQPWLAEATKGSPEALARVDFLKSASAHLGVEPKFPQIAAEADRLKQFLFFFERKKAGIDVNFSAEYDFDGDPKQDAAPAAGDDSDFG